MQTVDTLQPLLASDGPQDPYPFYAHLHRLGPVCRLDPADDRYDLVVHGYEAADQVLRDPHFTDAEASGGTDAGVTNAGSHGATARRVTALEPALAQLIRHRLDRLEAQAGSGAPVDLTAEFALPLAADVAAELIGVPDQDRTWFPPRMLAIGADTGDPPPGRPATRATMELTRYLVRLTRQRRRQPRADLISTLIEAERRHRQPASDDQIATGLVRLFKVSFMATTHLLTSGLILLSGRPDLRADLHAEPRRAAGYVEEITRYEPAPRFGVRHAVADTEVAGEPVRAGSAALVLLGAANRDPRRFIDPDTFDPHRVDNRPLSFGDGPHYCLSADLSRLAGRLALPALVRRFPRLALAGSPGDRARSAPHGYRKLAVTMV